MLTEKYVQSLIDQYAKSPAGRAAIKKAYGVDYTGDKTCPVDLTSMANEMREILFKYINATIKSSTFSINDIKIGKTKKSSRAWEWEITISIDKEAVRRESLYPQGYTEGLNDLILLYSTGYNARDYVHGYNKKKGRYMWSIPHRPQNDFLEKAVEEFNQKYNSGATWGELKPPYGGDTTI